MAAQRIRPGAGPHIVAADQQQVRDSSRVVRAGAVLRDAHGPQDAGRLGPGDLVGDLDQRLDGNAAALCGILHGEGLQAGAVLVEIVDPGVQELGLREAVVQQVAADGREPDQVGAGRRMEKDVGAARHLVLAQVAHDQPLPTQLVGALDARRQHGMRLRGVAADDDDQLRLFDIGDRTGVAAIADGAPQALRGWRLAVARAVVGVVGADNSARELLHEVTVLIGALRRGDDADGVGPVLGFDRGQPPRNQA